MLTRSKARDAGSQCRCGRVGRGIQPPFTSHAPLPDTHIQVQKASWHRATVTLEKLNFELLKKLRNELFELVTKPKSNFLLKKLNSELFFLSLFILAYFLKTCKWFDYLNEFLDPKSIHEWKTKKIKGCHVCDFNLSIFLQSKKMIKIHTYTPIFLHHIAVAQTLSQKRN